MPMWPPCMSQLELPAGRLHSARGRARPAIDGDEADSRLDQPACQQQVLPQGMPAVAVAHGRRLAFQVERLPARGPRRQLEGPLVDVLPFLLDAIVLAVGRIQVVQQSAAALQPIRLRRREQVGRLEARRTRIVGSRADEQRTVVSAKEAARADVRSAEDGIADALDQPDVGSDVALAGSHLGQHGADVRGVGGGFGLAAQAVVHGIEMVADVADVRHRPDQGEMPGQRGQAHVQLAEAHPGDGRGNRLVWAADAVRGIGLQVPGVEVAGSAAQQDEDARPLGRAAAETLLAIDPCGDHARHGQVQGAEPASLEKPAAREQGGGGPPGGR